ncbi:hypothetical protein TNCV_4208681 [Trichonephila clavipes]|nr:hypothetical protein TNCV_4208681 [Trichonephila clavipes]
MQDIGKQLIQFKYKSSLRAGRRWRARPPSTEVAALTLGTFFLPHRVRAASRLLSLSNPYGSQSRRRRSTISLPLVISLDKSAGAGFEPETRGSSVQRLANSGYRLGSKLCVWHCSSKRRQRPAVILFKGLYSGTSDGSFV